MANATLKKTEVMADQALFMLMTHSTDGVISEMAEEYFRLKQTEEVLKIRKRLAGLTKLKSDHHLHRFPWRQLSSFNVNLWKLSVRHHQEILHDMQHDNFMKMRIFGRGESSETAHDPVENDNNFVVHASSTAQTEDNVEFFNSFQNEDNENLQHFTHSQKNMNMSFLDFIPDSGQGVQHSTRDCQALDSDVFIGLGNTRHLRRREMSNVIEAAEEEDTCFTRNDYGSQGMSAAAYDDSQDCPNEGYNQFDLNEDCYEP